MLETPEIAHTATRHTAIIHLIIPQDEIQNIMGPGISEVFATIAAQGIAPTGPWFTHHRRWPTDTFDFEICVPVSAPIAAAGRVQPGEWPAMKVARTVYHGGYEGLGEAWGEFIDWIEANGHNPAPDLWECYLAGPESNPDPAAWRTQFNLHIID